MKIKNNEGGAANMRAALLTASKPELLDKDGDRMFRGLLYDYFAFSRSLDAARAKFARYADLSQTQYLILIAVVHSTQDEAMGINQIADRLYISPKTADHHIQHIYGKIGTSTRAGAALWAMQHAVVQ